MAALRGEDVQEGAFPGRISRRLSLAIGLLFLLVLLVGGVSMLLAKSIFVSTQEIQEENDHIYGAESIHGAISHLIHQLNRILLTGQLDRQETIRALSQDLDRQVRRYLERHEREVEIFQEKEREIMLIREALQMSGDLDRLSARIVDTVAGGRLVLQGDLDRLDEIAYRIPLLTRELNDIHLGKVQRLTAKDLGRLRFIVGAYFAFVLAGGLFIALWALVFSKTIASPLRSLASAALDIAAGNLRRRVPITSKDEIGQLSHSFNVMAQRLEEHEERLQALAVLKERERIARELHDSLAQALAYLRLKILAAGSMLQAHRGLEAQEALAEMRKVAEGAYEDVRQSIFGLRTMVSRSLGLIPTLAEYLHEFSEQSGIAVDLQIADERAAQLSPTAEIQLIRIVQEALANIRRHAAAKQAWVRFEVEEGFAQVTIEDDGRGFELEKVREQGSLRFGLQIMRERAEGLGGSLRIDTAPEKGTRVIVRLPL